MPRPKRKPSISEQMLALIIRAVEEQKYSFARELTVLLEKLEPGEMRKEQMPSHETP